MIETGVRTVMSTIRTVPAPVRTSACRRSSAAAHRDVAEVSGDDRSGWANANRHTSYSRDRVDTEQITREVRHDDDL
jgi:hypothetical protein